MTETPDTPTTIAEEASEDPHLTDAELAELFGDDAVMLAGGAWRIETLADADWALRRCGDLQAELAENEALLAKAVERLEARHSTLAMRIRRGLEFFTAKLREYAEQHRADLLKGGKRKSRALLNGTLGWRKKGGGLKVLDEAALLDWCRRQPVESGLLRVKEEPALAEVRRHFKESGEVADGCEPEPERDEFEAKPLKGDADAAEH